MKDTCLRECVRTIDIEVACFSGADVKFWRKDCALNVLRSEALRSVGLSCLADAIDFDIDVVVADKKSFVEGLSDIPAWHSLIICLRVKISHAL